MLALSLPLGMGAGAIDSALNNYVATNYSSRQMNFLHCFYGVGVSASPFLMSLALGKNNDWRSGYFLVFIILAVITLLSIIALPLWKKVKSKDENQENDDFSPKTLSLKQMSKMSAVRAGWVAFFCSIGLEFTCGIWGTTFLVKAEKLTEAVAASYLTLYYAGITISRLISGLISKIIPPKNIVYSGYSIVLVAIILLFLPLPAIFKGVALFLIGFGNGPTFPNLTYLTPINFGKENSQSIVATQMAACNLGILLLPPVFGFFADYISIKLFPAFIGALYLLMVIYTVLHLNRAEKARKGI
jgi:fucose permease